MILMGPFQLEIFCDSMILSFCLGGSQPSAACKSCLGGSNGHKADQRRKSFPDTQRTDPLQFQSERQEVGCLGLYPVLSSSPKPSATWEQAACRPSCEPFSQQEVGEVGGGKSSVFLQRRGESRTNVVAGS